MTITGTIVANTLSKFSNRQIPNSPVLLSTVTLETLISRPNSKLRSLRRRCTSPSVQDCLAQIGGVTSSGGWITCESIYSGTSHGPRRRKPISLTATPVRLITGQKVFSCGILLLTGTANRCFPVRAVARTHPVAVWLRSMADPIPSTKNVSLHMSVVCVMGSLAVLLAVYTMAQASRAITPKDPGGPWGQRIGANVAGGEAWTLRATAFVTKRNNPSDWWRYSIVVLNWYVLITSRFREVKKVTVIGRCDNDSGAWDPQGVTATISFRGQQVRFSFVSDICSSPLKILGEIYFPCWCDDPLVVCCSEVRENEGNDGL